MTPQDHRVPLYMNNAALASMLHRFQNDAVMRAHAQAYKRSLSMARMEQHRGISKDDLPVRRSLDAPHVRSSMFPRAWLGVVVFLAVLLLVLGLAVQSPTTTLASYVPMALISMPTACNSSSQHRPVTASSGVYYKGQLGDVTAAVEDAGCAPGAVCACPNTTDFAWFPGQGSAAGIPTILHQSAKDRTQLKPEWQICQRSWLTHHPNWTYFVWEDADNLALVQSHFPWFLEVYEAFPHFIMRVDAVRYMYMFLYGGMYADMDVECLRSVEPLLQGQQLVLARMGPEHDFGDSIPNAWFASVPGHPFWWQLLQQIKEDGLRAKSWGVPANEWPRAEWLTGPEALKRAWDLVAKKAAGQPVFDRSTQGHCAQVLPHHYIFPYSWWKGHSDLQPAACHGVRSGEVTNRTECVMHYPEAYAITYWSHSWE